MDRAGIEPLCSIIRANPAYGSDKLKTGPLGRFLFAQFIPITTVANSSGRGEKSDFRVPERSVLQGT